MLSGDRDVLGNLMEWDIFSYHDRFLQRKTMKVLDEGLPFFLLLRLTFFGIKLTREYYGFDFPCLARKFLPTITTRIGVLNAVDLVLLEKRETCGRCSFAAYSSAYSSNDGLKRDEICGP